MLTEEQRDAIRQRLAEIEAANGGRLTPSDVVRDARDPKSPLHSQFEWDKTKAAQQYWLDQARKLITSVYVKVNTEHSRVSVPFYIRDPAARSSEQGYVSVNRLRTQPEMAREAILAEFARVADILRRARELATVLGSPAEVESLLQGVVGLRQRYAEAPLAQQ
jgi:hypothetical protein